MLERMNSDLDRCRKSLLRYLEKRRHFFPRFYFLSMEDVLHIVCNGKIPSNLSKKTIYMSGLKCQGVSCEGWNNEACYQN